MAGQQTPSQPGPLEPNQQQQVPDHRFDELQKQIRLMEQQNAQLRGQIDLLSKGQPQQQEQKEPSPFEPDVEKALTALIKKEVSGISTQLGNQIGLLYDKTDEINFDNKYSGERFSKFRDRVNQIRHEQQLKGQWVSREEALRIAHFEQTGKKPQADTKKEEPVPNQPLFDPYMQQWIDPTTRQPVPPPEINAQGQPQAPQPVPQASTQPVNPQMPQAPVQQPAPQPGGIPQEVPFEKLPAQGLNPASPGAQPTQHQQINIDSAPEDLEAWSERYGDVPL